MAQGAQVEERDPGGEEREVTLSPVPRLYRAAGPNEDVFYGVASFSPDRETAEAYLDNPGFGGPVLYRTRKSVDPETAYDARGRSAQLGLARLLFPDDSPWDVVDVWEGRTSATEHLLAEIPAIRDGLPLAGFDWLIVTDDFPDGAETWIFLPSDKWVDVVAL